MRILIIEDDVDLATALVECLHAENMSADICHDGETGSYIARTNTYDAIVIDNILPKKTGVIVCRELRNSGVKTPILIMSVHGEVDTKVTFLDSGADDFIAKPFSVVELVARLKALMRRPYNINDSIITIDDVTIDSETQTVSKNGRQVYMTRKEFMILEHISKKPGKVVSRTDIMDHVWQKDFDPFSNSIETHIGNIRRKIDTGRCKKIETVPGRGYRIVTKDMGSIHKLQKKTKKLLKKS